MASTDLFGRVPPFVPRCKYLRGMDTGEELPPQQPLRGVSPESRPIPYDRVVGWVIFFVAVALFVAAMVIRPSSGDIPGVTAVDIGTPAADPVGSAAGGAGGAADGSSAGTDSAGSDAADEASESGPSADDGNAATTDDEAVTIAFTGDVLVHESVAGNAQTADGYDFAPQFAEVSPVLQAADLALCHLETPISTDNSSLSYFPAFLVPFQLADGLSGAGFDGCSVASNHSLDAGESGAQSTFAELSRVGLGIAGIAGPGETRGRSTIYQVKGLTVGHLSYTYGLNGLEPSGRNAELTNIIDAGAIEADAASLKSQGADFVIVSTHWGVEYTVDLTEQQAELGPTLIASQNIDFVVGHHAHVVQQVTEYSGEYVAYGLGNFLSNQSAETCDPCPASTQDGVILLIDVDQLDSGGFGVTNIRAVPTWVDRTNGHVIRVITGASEGPQSESLGRTTSVLRSTGTQLTIG